MLFDQPARGPAHMAVGSDALTVITGTMLSDHSPPEFILPYRLRRPRQ